MSSGSEIESVAVIGAGVMGLATAADLTERGYSVEVYEALDVGNQQGGSGGVGRIFRLTYAEPEAVKVLTDTARLWTQLEGRLGEALRSQTGGIDYGDDELIGKFADALTACDVPFDLVDEAEARATWPDLELDGRILVQADGALIHSERVLTALVGYLRAHDVPINEQASVTSLVLSSGAVELVAGGERKEFSQVVVCAGGATNVLCAGIIDLPPVRVTQEFTLTFDCEPAGEPFPVACDYRRPPIPGESYFWLPSAPGRMKVGAFATGIAVETSQADSAECPPDLEAVLRSYASETFAGGGELAGAEIAPCSYDFSPDEWFFARSAAEGRVIAAGGFSGHGFKFVPYVADCLARAVVSNGAEMPTGLPWSPS